MRRNDQAHQKPVFSGEEKTGFPKPGGKSYLSGDTPTKEISATDVLWEFFKQQPK